MRLKGRRREGVEKGWSKRENEHVCYLSPSSKGYLLNHLYFSNYAVPLRPRNIAALPNAPRTLLIDWVVPEVTNGPITSYNVVYMLVAMGTRMENSTNTSLVLDRLEPYANYTIAVQACTAAGCGPFSEEIIALTQEEGMCGGSVWMLRHTFCQYTCHPY